MRSSFSTLPISVLPALTGRSGITMDCTPSTSLMSPMIIWETLSRWLHRSPSAPEPASLLM